MDATARGRTVVEPDPDSEARDRYVLAHPRGTFCHLSAWSRAVRRAFRHETVDLVARRDGEVAGVLPLGHARSRLFGTRLVSAPFGVYGGPIADDADAERALLAAARAEAERLRVGSLELRCRGGGPPDWPGRNRAVTFRGGIAATDDGILASLPRKTRATVRKGLREGLVPDDDRALAVDFHRLLARNWRDHGTPVLPRRWIRALMAEFGRGCLLFSLRDGAEGPVVASTFAFLFRDEVAPYYVGARRDAHRRNVNAVLYYELMRRAREDGCRLFDFGRSKRGTGSYHFKRRWGLSEEPIDHRFHLVRDLEIPDVSPQNPRYARRIACWRRLPLWFANRLGPALFAALP